VVLHWAWPAMVLDDAGARELDRWTTRSLEAANEALPRLGVSFGAERAGPTDAT